MAEENTPRPGSNPLPPESDSSAPLPSELGESAIALRPDGSAAGAAALTPGQRLAAKKAQKAVQKREFKEELKRTEEATRQKELEEADRIFGRPQPEPGLPENVQKVAGTFSDFLHEQQKLIIGGLVGALALGALALGVQKLMRSGAAEQASALAAAFELANAPVDPDDTDGKTDDGKPVFKTAAERSSKALEAFSAVAKEGGEGAPAWALLAQAAIEVELGKLADAQKHFQSGYDANVDRPELAARALEGVGIALEGAGKLDEAQKTYEKLKTVGASKQLAELHLARLKLEKGDRDGAKALLKGLYDELKTPAEGVAPSAYLKNEVEVRLAELDSSLVAGSAPVVFDPAEYGNDPSKMSPEQIKRLIESLKQGNSSPGAGGE